MLRPHHVLVLLVAFGCAARAADRTLLEEAVDQWLGERDHWAFHATRRRMGRRQSTRAAGALRSIKPGDDRWSLLASQWRLPHGRAARRVGEEEVQENRRRFDAPLGDYFDFRTAKIVAETAKTVRYDVPLRRDKNGCFRPKGECPRDREQGDPRARAPRRQRRPSR